MKKSGGKSKRHRWGAGSGLLLAGLILSFFLLSCRGLAAGDPAESTGDSTEADSGNVSATQNKGEKNCVLTGTAPEALGPAAARSVEAAELPFFFVDVHGQQYVTAVDERVEKHSYDWSCLKRAGCQVRYENDPDFDCRLGVDVSSHQGSVDWEKVRAQGYEFAFLRIGYRGYGQEGKLCVDKKFHENIRGAQEAGLDVGVYFFSQAITEEEAKEEAALVLENLKGYELQCPVVFDPESILDDVARTDGVPGEQFTKNSRVFCEEIREAGFAPMIYSNMLWEAFWLDLWELSDYPIWYADYEPAPQTPYHFVYWQYSNKGRVDGIEGDTDLNLQFLPK